MSRRQPAARSTAIVAPLLALSTPLRSVGCVQRARLGPDSEKGRQRVNQPPTTGPGPELAYVGATTSPRSPLALAAHLPVGMLRRTSQRTSPGRQMLRTDHPPHTKPKRLVIAPWTGPLKRTSSPPHGLDLEITPEEPRLAVVTPQEPASESVGGDGGSVLVPRTTPTHRIPGSTHRASTIGVRATATIAASSSASTGITGAAANESTRCRGVRYSGKSSRNCCCLR